MPAHDWTRVEAGIFHHFHHAWIEQITRSFNQGILPPDYYALAEQQAAGFGPDVLSLQSIGTDDEETEKPVSAETDSQGGLLLLAPKVRLTEEADLDYYRRKQNAVVVRHVSGDRMVAVVEVVSPGNKGSRHAIRSFLEKAAALLERGIHLLVLDLLPPGPRDPGGIHAAIWDEITGQESTPIDGKPLTLASYESDMVIRAYVEPIAVGDVLPAMPLFLKPRGHVLVPLEEIYQAAWESVPLRWRKVVAG
jgi:hypothetical protein